MTLPRLDRLVESVQTNCHIADASHAADLTLCVYLLQMRELYRWESGIALGAALARDAVGQWLAERERLWADLEGEPWRRIEIDGETFDAFDVDAINARLEPHALVYGAGLAGPSRPGFFLAALESVQHREGTPVVICGCEHARGLFAPPAALGGDAIVLRRESMARWLWEKFEAYGLKRADGAFKAVADAYGLERDFHGALPRLLDEQGETLILHELGERRAGLALEPGWAAMRLALRERRSELLVRAVRDHLADLTVTLPTLLARGDSTAIHFWFSNFDGFRRELFPALADAYAAWCAGDGARALHEAVRVGAAHFALLADAVLALHAQHGEAAGARIGQMLGAAQAVCRGG